jgi:ubiquinone/menaquinone biosynthesis C-methylase UbiE
MDLRRSSPLSTPAPWNLVAADYAEELVPVFSNFAADALRLAQLAPGARVLDVAAGPGTLACLAARAGARTTAIDFSRAMADRLAARTAAEGLTIDVRVGDGQALPFGEGAFEAAFSMFGLIFFPDRARGFRELLRVLVPSGVAVVSSWVPVSRVPIMEAMFTAIAELQQPGQAKGPSKGPLATPDDCREEMGAAGFTAVQVKEVTYGSRHSSMAALWDFSVRTAAPLALLRESLGGSAWAELSAGVMERLVARFGEGPQDMALPANLLCGRRP